MTDTITLPREFVQKAVELLDSSHVSTALVWPRYACVEALAAALAAPPVHGLQHVHDAIMADPSVCDIDEPVAWLVTFENGEQELHFDKQCVGESQVPLYAAPVKQADDFAIRGKITALYEALKDVLAVANVRIDDPRISVFDNARAALALVGEQT